MYPILHSLSGIHPYVVQSHVNIYNKTWRRLTCEALIEGSVVIDDLSRR